MRLTLSYVCLILLIICCWHCMARPKGKKGDLVDSSDSHEKSSHKHKHASHSHEHASHSHEKSSHSHEKSSSKSSEDSSSGDKDYTCMDGKKNKGETDTDCGGNKCPKCANKKKCRVDSDCISSFCDGKKCAQRPTKSTTRTTSKTTTTSLPVRTTTSSVVTTTTEPETTNTEPEATTELEPEATTELEPETTTTEPEATTEVEPETTTMEPEATTELEPEATTELEPETTTEPEPETTTTEPEATTEPEPETTTMEPEPEPEPEPDTTTMEPEPEPEPETTTMELEPEPEPETTTMEPEPEPETTTTEPAIITPASPTCDFECKNNGTCTSRNQCTCRTGFSGPACEVQSVGLCFNNETFETDPLLLITFGSGSAQYSSATPAHFNFTTTYRQGFKPKTNDGMFSFVNSVNDDFHGAWHTGAKDHSAGDNGYMYLVNADRNPGQFYNGSVDHLCLGLRYEFSVYLANLCKPRGRINPNVLFEVRSTGDNVLLAQLESGNVTEHNRLTWQKYGISFIATSSSVNLLMISKARGGGGNDLVIDDIALRVCAHEGAGFCPELAK